MNINDILNGSDYSLAQFTAEQIAKLESSIIVRNDKNGKEIPYINCIVRSKEIKLTPEETVRQLYLMTLTENYGYPVSRMELEYVVTFGREKKRADIVIFDKDQTTTPYIIVELKSPKWKDGKEQLKSYCNGTGAPIGVWTNGETISHYHRKDPNFFEDIPNIPKAAEKLSDILEERWTIKDLVEKDKLVNERKSLKDLILDMEDEVLANAGVDVFEEVFKLIFTKLYDEMESGRKPDRHLEFRNYGDTETELKEKLQSLFDKAKEKWEGVFSEDSKLMLTPSHLSVCVSSLQDVKLFNSNLDVVDEAFEYLINKSSKGEKGQYFTPRYVIDMCVRMLNPNAEETMIDTAAGSCGFPVHTIFYVWQKILESKGMKKSHLFTLEKKPAECTDYVQSKVFAIDFDERAVRVARTLNLIAGDGQTNVMHLNTLDYDRWDDFVKEEAWQDTYGEGWRKLKKLRSDKESYRDFQFDILMANPPFAGDIKESRILAKYELSKNAAGKMANKMGRDILFIERNLDFLKPGGRMAIVLPQGRFNNSSDKYIRDYIAERCRILAVVGLHGNVFKPHTGTKTSVLFVQKWDDTLCPKKEDYPIFFATMQEPSKDNSGEKIFVKATDVETQNFASLPVGIVAEPTEQYNTTRKATSEYLLDDHGHLIVKHDLFNHDGLTQDGIAEAFAEFAKKEGLSFSSNLSQGNDGVNIEMMPNVNIKFFSESFGMCGRLDAEYYQKKYDEMENAIKSYKGGWTTIESLRTYNARGTQPDYVENGELSVINSKHILEDGLDYNHFERTNASAWNVNKSRVMYGDILTYTTGANIGRTALYLKKEKAVASNHVNILRVEGYDSICLGLILNSAIGRLQTEKKCSGSAQLELYPKEIDGFIVPNFPPHLQQRISALVQKSFELMEESKRMLDEAKRMVEEEIERG